MTINFKDAIKAMRSRTGKLGHEGDYWTAEETELLRTMFNNFIGITEIAITLQRTEAAVEKFVLESAGMKRGDYNG